MELKALKDLPPWGKRVVSVVKVASFVLCALFAFVAGALDLYAKYDEVNRKAESSYETLAPAVQELQDLFAQHISETNSWVEEVEAELEDRDEILEDRVTRLEGAIEKLSRRHRGLVPPEPVEEFSEAPEDFAEEDFPSEEPAPRAKKPARYVPDRLEEAADYQEQRQKAQCSPDDPKCGLK